VIVSLRAQNTTSPVALLPKVDAVTSAALFAAFPQPAMLVAASAASAAHLAGRLRYLPGLRTAQLLPVPVATGSQTRIGDTPRLAHW
jgi:hypothetical protein